MWELSIRLKKEFSKPADFIFNSLKKDGANFGAIITKLEQHGYIDIVIACEEYDKARLKIFTSNAIIEAICTYFKQDFLENTLKLPIKEGLYFHALKKALISFDKETDSFLISKHLDLDTNINLESFYYFKLRALRDKWAELTNIANENGYFLINNENFVDLLKFLVDNLEITHDTINVYFENNTYKIFDARNRDLPLTEDDDIVCSIIGLSPRQINFYGEINKDEKVCLLEQIYSKRVHFKSIN